MVFVTASGPYQIDFSSNRFETLHRSRAGSEAIRFNAKPLQNTDEKVRQRIVVCASQREMPCMAETASGD